MNRKIKKYLDEIEKTEKKIADLEMYLKGVRSALKEEENNEMIKSIRGMKLKGQELFDLLNGIQDGTISFVASGRQKNLAPLLFRKKKEKVRKMNMVKWKKLNKKLVMLLTAAMMLFGSQATAFAYVDQGTEAAQEESTTETEEPVVEDTHTEENGDPFSVPGNGEVRDDITDDSSKEFLTIKTKNNNTFYIVIDRAATTNNVYMLSQIDENDLKEFLDEDQQQTLETAPSVVLEDEHTDDTENSEALEEETKEDKQDKAATNSGLFVILLLAVAGIAGYYYFKIYKPKQEEDDAENEGLEMDDGLETINEDEESDNPAEKDESQE